VVRERLGVERDQVTVPPGACVRDLLAILQLQRPALTELLPAVRISVNQEFRALDFAVADGDEVAIIPPVSGGAGLYRVTDQPLELDEVVRAVGGASQGGLVTFTGVVREQSRGKTIVRLEYEAYRPMAERKLAEIGEGIAKEIAGARVAIVHRLGKLVVGEAAVVIAASAPHRAEAFDACRAAIDRLKHSVPIWKKEIADDGEEWVGLGP
jgi:molybdopterin synthase catalytic subunit